MNYDFLNTDSSNSNGTTASNESDTLVASTSHRADMTDNDIDLNLYLDDDDRLSQHSNTSLGSSQSLGSTKSFGSSTSLSSQASVPTTKASCWQYFDSVGDDKKKSKCKLCSAVISTCGNSSNAWSHLNRNHKQIFVSEKGKLNQYSLLKKLTVT